MGTRQTNEPALEEERGQGRGTAESKRVLRKAALAKRDSLTKEQRFQKSGRIAERLLAHPWYRETENLLVYASYRSEVSTEQIIRNALRSGKQVYCPVVTGKREMVFCALDGPLADAVLSSGLAAMEKDRHGIPQPDQETCARYRYQPEKSLMLMPGCAFDNNGNRIGYGGGFYDSFLAERPMRTIALFFDCQRTDEAIAGEPHDVRPDRILTESGFHAVESGGIRNGESEPK
ncbi:MAG: 5-formyltetrahydrofolate cyclo-ligase [Clostridium sp.]|nr:5-formyltetrahydrofolate cyclo-ligase [Clostridium sp.]